MYTYTYMNYTLYIAGDITGEFQKEDNKSGLVNGLLRLHYGKSGVSVLRTEPTTNMRAVNKAIDLGEAINAHKSLTVPKEYRSAIPKEFIPRFCKNGHPIPAGRDKCLGKGCKYS